MNKQINNQFYSPYLISTKNSSSINILPNDEYRIKYFIKNYFKNYLLVENPLSLIITNLHNNQSKKYTIKGGALLFTASNNIINKEEPITLENSDNSSLEESDVTLEENTGLESKSSLEESESSLESDVILEENTVLESDGTLEEMIVIDSESSLEENNYTKLVKLSGENVKDRIFRLVKK